MNPYEERQERRRERLEARAERLAREAAGAFRRADLREEVSGIPFGQPILVGHHSERRHRAAIARAHRAMEKGVALHKAAGEAEAMAASVGSGGISSDDPDAVVKLREQLEGLEQRQAFMGAANKIVRAFYKAGARNPSSGDVFWRYLAKLQEIKPGISADVAASMLQPDCFGGIGFASYQLSNNGANVRRIKERIAHLDRMAQRAPAAPVEVNGVEIRENAELNRLQLLFPGKPDAAIRSQLKRAGFRWAPSEGAWQRQLGHNARWQAEQIVAGLA